MRILSIIKNGVSEGGKGGAEAIFKEKLARFFWKLISINRRLKTFHEPQEGGFKKNTQV